MDINKLVEGHGNFNGQ